MQALIDFDGWRKWKDFASQDKRTAAETKSSITTPPTGLLESAQIGDKANVKDRKPKREKKLSIGGMGADELSATRRRTSHEASMVE